MGKLLLLTLNEQEEKVIDKIIAAISDYAQFEAVPVIPVPVLSFPGLEIRQSQRRVFQDGEEVNLTRLEYSTLVFLASNPGIVFTQMQIFEAVWNMDSDSCHSSVVNVIYNLRKKIEPAVSRLFSWYYLHKPLTPTKFLFPFLSIKIY